MSRSKASMLSLMVIVVACAPGGRSEEPRVEIIQADLQDVSPPLSELARSSVSEVREPSLHEAEPLRPIPHMHLQSMVQQVDPVLQSAIGGPNIPSTTVSFEGMAGFTVQSAPPDTDGDIGPNHYVQIVNSSVTIFSRAGAKLLGPVNTNTFWGNGACATTNDGEGVVRYDRIADRWVIAQFSVTGGNGLFYQCVAVSTGPDPTGSYARYQFSYPAFNDYPKIGLWPNGYYFTFNMFPNNVFGGAKVCAYDRAKMLTAAPATMECFDTSNQFGGLLPSDLDGPTLPPPCTPNYVAAIDTNAIDFWKMQVSFGGCTAGFIGPTMIPVAAYTPLCNGGTCVVQPGTTQRLDSLADRAMNRFVYRNFGDHEALLMSHAVTAGSGGGVRWYELRNPATTPTIFQQGTYAPDVAFRWMSSMAFDASGNIGLCFTISSSTINPGIRYTGRLVTDPLGTMGQGEATIIAGTGSQTGNLSRWGDYSSLNIDPTDDCTFWCTNEYIAANGVFNWRTRIAAFRFATCPLRPDFNITPAPTSRTVAPGTNTTYAVNSALQAGAAQPMILSVSGLPSNVTASFNPTIITAGGSSTLTVTAAANAISGTTLFPITAMGTARTHTANASVIVDIPPTVAITSPANGSTVSGTTVPVAATATDSDGSVVSVKFELPDGTSVIDNTPPFSAIFDSTMVMNGSGYVIHATATDNLGMTATSTVTITVNNCINSIFNAIHAAEAIPDNNNTGITWEIPVTCIGNITSLLLSLNITHTARGDLVVTLTSPGGTQFIVWSRQDGLADDLIISNLLITAFNGQAAVGTWKLTVQDLAPGDIGTLNSWSITVN